MAERPSVPMLSVVLCALAGLVPAVFSGVALAQSAPDDAAPIVWDGKYWNPQAQADDLVLPMPCGGAMAFRPVRTPNSDGAIGDVPILLGQEGGDQPFLTGLRRSYVSGAFADPTDKTVKGLFYMGKYELAQAQYDVVMSQTCPDKDPRKRDFLPAVGLSKLDFEAFSERYTLWLMASAAGALPEAGTTGAYLRLPTEEEWEFAARGGLAVEAPLFRATLPPIPDGRSQNEYIASAGNDSAGGKVQVVGTLQPNPLGLHDMLGNVAEYVQSPFALVRHGRLHGQAGGIVKRGGDARTPLERISSALRLEVPPFDTLSRDVTRDDYTGVRFVLAGLSIASREQSEKIISDLDALARADVALSSASSEAEVLDQLDRLASASADQEAAQYRRIADTIRAARAENNEQRDRSIRLILDSAVRSCDQTVGRYLNSLAIGALLPGYDQIEAEAKAVGDQAMLDELAQARAEADKKLADLRALIDREVMDYATLIEGLAAEYSLDLLQQQAQAIQAQTDARGERRAACLSSVKSHVTNRSEAGAINIQNVEADMRDIALWIAK